MFQIKSYLQYKNTLDGKPRVLVEDKDYFHKSKDNLWQFKGYSNTPDFEGHLVEKVANLEDCRPLLTVEIDGVEWTEGDIINTIEFFNDNDDYLAIMYFDQEDYIMSFESKYRSPEIWDFKNKNILNQKPVSFFDDPTKYSKLLWNCTQEEGWEKVLTLLSIK